MPDQPRPRLGHPRRIGGEGEPEIFVADEQDVVTVDAARWQRLAADVLAAEGVRGHAELSILFVGTVEMAELNGQFMGHDGPTDVLAFPIDAAEVEVASLPTRSVAPDRAPADPGDLPLLLGDVVVCPEVAAAQYEAHAGTLDDEVALLVVHGILHVLGHDHAADDERERMRAREVELLEAHHWRGPAPAAFRQDQE